MSVSLWLITRVCAIWIPVPKQKRSTCSNRIHELIQWLHQFLIFLQSLEEENKLKCSNMLKFCCSLNKLRNLFQYAFSDLNQKLNGALTIQNKHFTLIVHEKEQSFLNISAILLLFLIKFSGCEPFLFMYFFFLTLFSLTTCLTMIFSLLATPTAKGEHITNDDFSFLMRALLH